MLWPLARRECDSEANTLKCGWDGGDCCEETCLCHFTRCSTSCGSNGYNCIRPPDEASENDTCECCEEEAEGIVGYESYEASYV
jgi:hypothetical protein